MLHEARFITDDILSIEFVPKTWPSSSHVYLIKDQDGLTMIDSGIGTDKIVSSMLSCLQENGFEPSLIHTVLVTHAHTDHIGAISQLKKYANPRILIPELDVLEATTVEWQEHYIMPYPVRCYYLDELKSWDLSDHFFHTCGDWLLESKDISQRIKDGDEIRIGKYFLRAICTQGHDIGEMVYWEPDHKILFAGDLLRCPGTALPWYSYTAGGVEGYLESLATIKTLKVELALPSHGRMEKSYEENVSETCNIILGREKTILAALTTGPKTFKELDRLVYPEWLWRICPWSSSVTHAHLLELKRRGMVKEEGNQFVGHA